MSLKIIINCFLNENIKAPETRSDKEIYSKDGAPEHINPNC